MNTGDQNLSIDGHLLTLSGGNTVQIPDSANDADADPVNEIQTLSLVGDLLSLSKDGGSVQLPACATGGAYYY
ncbi:MAG: hypothetical protein JXR41_00665, partial [Bacteroidales bacterium]|nr:hypothetical protein [Bacteroidales bacterium]